MFSLTDIQSALREFQFDAWLIYDFRGSNLPGRRILDLGDRQPGSRRWVYVIPATGEPRKLVHRIEPGALDHLPGDRLVYLRWQEFEAGVADLIGGARRVAMEYSPRNANPYVARVDAGFVELARSCGAEVASSGDLISTFEASWDDAQWQMHREAAVHTDAAYPRAWKFIADRVRENGMTTEGEVLQEILRHFDERGLFADHHPIVGVNAHSGDPHYETGNAPIRAGDFVLIDLWAKMARPRAVYSDLTRVGFVGDTVPARYDDVFQVVAAARDAAIERVRQGFATGERLPGWKVDQAARDVIERAGYGPQFVHRTGHSIGQETHGNGANIDNLETHEERLILRRTCFSIEPGIYLPEFGVRSEINVFVDAAGEVHVTGGELQRRVVAITSV
ncbi:MAG: M24 family metallopeptidase [Planctomycetota bacterium]|nr:M24 family metallopeptidase [Planctomycetota bacterium]